MKSYIYGAKPLDLLAVLIGLALAGSVAHFFFFAPAKLQELRKGWSISVMEPAEDINDSLFAEEAPVQDPEPQQDWIPDVQVPQFDLGQMPAIEMPESKPKSYRWEIQEHPCDDRAQLGSHWSGADCMYHCLIYD